MITSKGLMQLGFVPEKDFVLQDDGSGTYISEWLSSSDRPTTADIEAAHAVWQAEYDAQEYARNRKAEYDALNQFEMQYDDEVSGTTTWKDAIDAIKTKYPKPS